MAGLSAGEVFVTLSIKGQGVGPALKKASKELSLFGKQLTALSVATGSLIADGLKFAFSKLRDIASFAFDAAKLDPRTAADTQKFTAATDALFVSLGKLGAGILSMVLPSLIQLTDYFTFFIDEINNGITWFESFGAVAALQTGNVAGAVDILWKQIQILFLQGSQIVLGLWDSMTGGFIDSWQSMSGTLLSIISDVFKKSGDSIAGFMTGLKLISPALASQLSSLDTLGSALQQAGNIAGSASQAANTSATKQAEERRKQAEEGQKILQAEIDALRSQVASQSESAVSKRDLKRATDAAISTGQQIEAEKNTVSGTSSAFAMAAAGGSPVYQTQKDLLKEAREQKEIAKKNLAQLERLAAGGMVFE